MSQYRHQTEIDGRPYNVMYGFDHMLSEYFIDVTNPQIEVTDEMIERGEEPNVVLRASSYGINALNGKNTSNSTMYEHFKQWDVNPAHIQFLVMDLPF